MAGITLTIFPCAYSYSNGIIIKCQKQHQRGGPVSIKIQLTSIVVNDQDKALDFYTNILGFVKITEIPMGEYRWLTVGSPEQDGIELSLEPNAYPAAKEFYEKLQEEGIPATAFSVSDLEAEYKRLLDLNVVFTTPPKEVPGAKMAVFNDQCGNLIQLYEKI